MSVGQLPYPEQISFPPVDVSKVTPTVADVALLEHTRTLDTGSNELGAFTSDTRPTDTEVQALIAQAVTIVLAPLPDYFQESLYDRVRQAVALQTALLIESSFYREQANTGTIVALGQALSGMLSAIEADAGGARSSARVDSIVLRSTIAEYDPYYPLPPPPVVGGSIYAALPSTPPSGPPQINSISPTSSSLSSRVNVTVTASGQNLVVTADLVAFLVDSTGALLPSMAIADPSGNGSMLAVTFPPPPATTALGAGVFHLLKGGTPYGPDMAWDWIA